MLLWRHNFTKLYNHSPGTWQAGPQLLPWPSAVVTKGRGPKLEQRSTSCKGHCISQFAIERDNAAGYS